MGQTGEMGQTSESSANEKTGEGAPAYGTARPEDPVARADFERAIRSLNMSDLDLRNALLNVAARVVALTDEMTRRLDGVEPLPAPPDTPAAPSRATVEATVQARLGETLTTIQVGDASGGSRVTLDLGGDKYATASPDVPCAELIALCHGRCCTLSFALSTADLDEGVIRWDYGQPYLIRQRASDGYCVHSDPDSRACTVHRFRPRVCRTYDCRRDPRVWIDYERRIAAPMPYEGDVDKAGGQGFNLIERAQARAAAVRRETRAINESFAEPGPRKGPRPPG
jgi:Fe-S-cluster containining protein